MKNYVRMNGIDNPFEPTHTAHISVDYRNDFAKPGAPLYVPGAETMVGLYNETIDTLGETGIKTVFTGDEHIPGMDSLASTHGVTPFTQRPSAIDTIPVDYYWPDHCMKGTKGVELFELLDMNIVNKNKLFEILKGRDKSRELYSAFGGTDLHEKLQQCGIKNLLISGLATDRCVAQTALDAIKLGYKVLLIKDLMKGIDPIASEKAIKLIESLGGGIIHAQQIKAYNEPIAY